MLTQTDAARLRELAFAAPGDRALWLAASDAAEEAGDDAAAAFLRWGAAVGLKPCPENFGLKPSSYWFWWRMDLGNRHPARGDIPKDLFAATPGTVSDRHSKDYPTPPDAYAALLAGWRLRWYPGYVPKGRKT